MEISFTYWGKVIGQPRPRFRRNGKPYDTKQASDYKKAIAKAYKEQCGNFSFGKSPISMLVYAERELPKNKKRKTFEVTEPDTFKPDADNIAKAIMDALNGIAYEDDSQIVRLFIRKRDRRSHGGKGDFVMVFLERIDEDEA